ncbi:MAG: acylphosphatase, partial [Actinomycetota bacterium]
MEDRTRVHVFVHGDIEGTGFKEAIHDKAVEQGVVGWVKELSDGRIEAVLEGPRDEVYRV